MAPARPTFKLYLLVFASGVAGLSWELLWQHYAALAVGVSAAGTAITLAATMLGLAIGSLGAGRLLKNRDVTHPLRLYGILELVIGLVGTQLALLFALLGSLDTLVYQQSPAAAPIIQLVGIFLLLGVPTVAMGATIPVFSILAPRFGTSIGRLYALNTAGACIGILVAAFALLPELGVHLTGIVVALINIGVFVVAFFSSQPVAIQADADAAPCEPPAVGFSAAMTCAAITGAATFCLEVAWFRSMRAAFQSTTDSFALMLASVLAALAVGARLGVRFSNRRTVVAWALSGAGVLVLLATPLVERFDALAPQLAGYWTTRGVRLAMCVAVIGPPMVLLGSVLPWLLERYRQPDVAGKLYAINTGAAVAGSLAAAWILLPGVGFAKTTWIVGAILALAGAALAASRARWIAGTAAVAALSVAIMGNTGIGHLRVQGAHLRGEHVVVASREGPDATVAVIEHAGGVRELVIDGFQTSGEAAAGHYMAWMGHLPMMVHPAPKRALVICFGTGQTANAVRREGPEHLDIVELSNAVISMAEEFTSNQGVLDDPRVRTIIMDGRAWLRRTQDSYDVVTLEPMAPYFAGTNALYSREFYQLVAKRLRPGGVVAQWLPFHLVAPHDSAAIAHTFQSVFADSLLWVDPSDRTGILIGRLGVIRPGEVPGTPRPPVVRDLSAAQVQAGFVLNAQQVARYGQLGPMITDDNQQLAYGSGRYERWNKFFDTQAVHQFNLDVVNKVAAGDL